MTSPINATPISPATLDMALFTADATPDREVSKSMKPADVAKARELYAQGMGSGRIGKLLGFDNKTVLKAVNNL